PGSTHPQDREQHGKQRQGVAPGERRQAGRHGPGQPRTRVKPGGTRAHGSARLRPRDRAAKNTPPPITARTAAPPIIVATDGPSSSADDEFEAPTVRRAGVGTAPSAATDGRSPVTPARRATSSIVIAGNSGEPPVHTQASTSPFRTFVALAPRLM